MASRGLTCSSYADASHVVETECYSLNPESSELEYLHLNNRKLVWKNDLESLKKFVENILELQGKWLSPAGSTKQFKSSNGNVIINWYYKKQHTLNSESVEINAFSQEKTAKNCRDKTNNLNNKYKTVKDKSSKSTGEGSDEIKSFPEFTDLDELWGTRDTVTNECVVEAGSNDQPIDETSTEGSDHDESEQEDLSFDAPLSSSLRRKHK